MRVREESRWHFANLYVRLALAAGFLSAVVDHFG